MTTAEKLAYLKGVLAASNITDMQHKRIYEAIVDVLESVVEDVEFNTENIDNIDSRLSEVDEDLELAESILYDEDIDEGFDEDFDEEFDYSEDVFAGDDDLPEKDEFDEEIYEDELDDELEDEFEEDVEEDDEAYPEDAPEEDDVFDDAYLEDEEGEEMYEIECPACHETIYLQESVILDGGVDCPNCGEPLEFDIEFEEE